MAAGTKLLTVIQTEADAAGQLDWNVSVDSSVVRADQHSATAKRFAVEDSAQLVEHTGAASNENRGVARTNRAITASVAPAAA
jgi:hypothetical protein